HAGGFRVAAVNQDLAAGKVGERAGVVGAHVQAAFRCGAGAACGEAGDAAVGEVQAGIGDIPVPGDDVYAARLDVGDGRVHQRQHHVDVVDHEIEYHADVAAAAAPAGQATRLDVTRRGQVALQFADGAVEALQVAGLQHEMAQVGFVHQLAGGTRRGGEGFLDQQMRAGAQQRHCARLVRMRGNDDAGDVWRVGGIDALEARYAGKLARGKAQARGVAVDDGDQLDGRMQPVLAGMQPSVGAIADDGGAQWRVVGWHVAPSESRVLPRLGVTRSAEIRGTAYPCGVQPAFSTSSFACRSA